MKTVKLAVITAIIAASTPTYAQTGTGDAKAQNQPSTVGLSGANLARFRTYAMRAGHASYRYAEPLRAGVVLPEAGMTYYDLPGEYGITGYRYTIINDQPILVEPETRRIIQVID